MNNIKRRDRELPYIADREVLEEYRACRRLLHRLNHTDLADFAALKAIVKELLGNNPVGLRFVMGRRRVACALSTEK